MKIKIQGAPSEKVIRRCEKILAYFLQTYIASVKIIIRDKPREIIKPHWIDRVILTTNDNEEIIINWWDSFTEDIDEKTDNLALWSVAWSIQNTFYKKMNLTMSDSPSDPYWKLWDYRK